MSKGTRTLIHQINTHPVNPVHPVKKILRALRVVVVHFFPESQILLISSDR